MARPARGKIKEALGAYIREKGLTGEHFVDVLEDYMSLYDTKRSLLQDIKTRGAKVTVYMANGTGNIKTNDSVQDLLRVNTQMLKILDTLGVEASKARALGADDKL